jgi:hypothetical protein
MNPAEVQGPRGPECGRPVRQNLPLADRFAARRPAEPATLPVDEPQRFSVATGLSRKP